MPPHEFFARQAHHRLDRKTALLGNVIPLLTVQDDRGLNLEPYSDQGESFYSRFAPKREKQAS